VRLGLGMGVLFVVTKAVQISTERFGMGWWAAELIQVGVVVIAFLLITRKVAQLEGQVISLRAEVHTLRIRLDGIKILVTKELKHAGGKVLELVS